MHDIFDIANYFLFLGDRNEEDCITNLKLQKLCYYAKGFYLALHGVQLFDNNIEAWQHGPVVRDLYIEYKRFENKNIPVSKALSINVLPSNIKVFLNQIYLIYGQYSAWKLRNMTHRESPWLNAVDTKDKIIPDTELTAFFQTSNRFQYFKDHIHI